MGGVQVGAGGEYGIGEMRVQSMGEVGKDFCPNFLQPFLENIDRRSCNDGRRELIPVFHNPHRKCGSTRSHRRCGLSSAFSTLSQWSTV